MTNSGYIPHFRNKKLKLAHGLYLSGEVHQSGTVRKMLLEIEDEMCCRAPCCSVVAKYSLFFALSTIIRNHPGINHQKSAKAADHLTQSIKLSIDYIQRNFDQKLTLEKIASVACLSPTYYSCIFKKLNGVSVWKYINIKRVEKPYIGTNLVE